MNRRQAARGVREAVALAYGPRAAPVVTARGHGEVADRIVLEAQRQGVHVSQDPALLAMLSKVDIDEAIDVLREAQVNHPGVRMTLFGDGSVRTVAQQIDAKTLRALFTRDGGDAVTPF